MDETYSSRLPQRKGQTREDGMGVDRYQKLVGNVTVETQCGGGPGLVFFEPREIIYSLNCSGNIWVTKMIFEEGFITLKFPTFCNTLS